MFWVLFYDPFLFCDKISRNFYRFRSDQKKIITHLENQKLFWKKVENTWTFYFSLTSLPFDIYNHLKKKKSDFEFSTYFMDILNDNLWRLELIKLVKRSLENANFDMKVSKFDNIALNFSKICNWAGLTWFLSENKIWIIDLSHFPPLKKMPKQLCKQCQLQNSNRLSSNAILHKLKLLSVIFPPITI